MMPSIELPEYSWEYFILIPLPIFLHNIAMFLTIFALVTGYGYECNSVSDSLFKSIGMPAVTAIQTGVLLVLLLALPIAYNATRKPTPFIYFLFSIMIVACGLDAIHNIFAVFDHPMGEITEVIIRFLFSVIRIPYNCGGVA